VTGGWTGLVNGTAWTVNAALQPATTYWWQVRAVNAGGQMTQADGGRWWYFTTAATSGAPAAFGKLAAGEQRERPGSRTATLNWDAANDATGYQRVRRPPAGRLRGQRRWLGGRWRNVTPVDAERAELRDDVLVASAGAERRRTDDGGRRRVVALHHAQRARLADRGVWQERAGARGNRRGDECDAELGRGGERGALHGLRRDAAGAVRRDEQRRGDGDQPGAGAGAQPGGRIGSR
jgi:hypothetical protein